MADNQGYAMSPELITFLVGLGAAALVVACAAVSRVTGFGWPDNVRDPHSVSDSQAIYMREVRDRNWADARAVAAGARRPPY